MQLESQLDLVKSGKALAKTLLLINNQELPPRTPSLVTGQAEPEVQSLAANDGGLWGEPWCPDCLRRAL